MTKIITARVDQVTALRIQKAVEKSHTDTSALLRTFIIKGLEIQEQEDALERYKKGDISIGKLADELKITKWDALGLLNARGIHIPYSEEDLSDDLENFS